MVYSYQSTLKLSGNVTFMENKDTVLYMISSLALVSVYSTVTLKNNSLSYGRLVVIECSVVTLSEHTMMEFIDNGNVSVVVISFCGLDFGVQDSECFLQYINKCMHPNNWNTKIVFSGNYGCSPNQNDWKCFDSCSSATLPASIFDTNILSCAWPTNGSDDLSSASFHSIFKWKPF